MNALYNKVESGILKEKDIRLKGVLKKRKETLEEFLLKFFTKFNNEYETIFVENGYVFCDAQSRRRSVTDVYKLCKYYYPKCTLLEIRDLMFVKFCNDINGWRSCFCGQVKRRVFYINEADGHEIYNMDVKDENGMTWNDWLNLK